MKKRILIFSTAYYPRVGGAEVAVKEITDRLPNYEFDLITYRFGQRGAFVERLGNVTVYRTGMVSRHLLPFFAYRKARSLSKKKKYHVAWAIMASQAAIAAAWFVQRDKKIKLLLTLQEGDEEKHLMRYVRGSIFLYKKLIRPLYVLPFKKASKITVISNYLKDRAQKENSLVPIAVIPNGVDIQLFKSTKQWPRGDKDRVLITTSRLVEKNAVDTIIRAMRYLPGSVKLFILGTGPLEGELKRLVAEEGAEDRVGFFGFVKHEEMDWYFKKADIFVRPSRSEGLGNSFLEAMAAGVPVIGTPVGGIPDFLEDKKTGFFCTPDDPRDLAMKIAHILNPRNANSIRKIIENARTLVSERYSWGIVAEQMDEVFKEL